MKLSCLLVVLALTFGTSTNGICQSVRTSVDDGTLVVELSAATSRLHVGDTLTIEIRLKNKSDSGLLIIDPLWIHRFPPTPSESEIATGLILDSNGSDWIPDLGSSINLHVRLIPSRGEFSYSQQLVATKECLAVNDRTVDKWNSWLRYESRAFLYMTMIAYVKQLDLPHDFEIKVAESREVRSDSWNQWFDQHLIRLPVSPILLHISL